MPHAPAAAPLPQSRWRDGRAAAPFSGGFAEYLYLSAPQVTFMLKMDAPPTTVVLSEPLGVAVTAVRRAAPKLGETIVVQGCGAIGLLTLGVAKQAGATRAIVVGGPRERLEVAREFGADVVIDIDAGARSSGAHAGRADETVAGLGADLVFGCVGLAPAWLEGIGYVRDGGRFMELGLASDTGDVTFNPCTQLVAKNINLMGTLGLENYQDALTAGRILEAGRLPFDRVVSHQLPLTRVADAIEPSTPTTAGRRNRPENHHRPQRPRRLTTRRGRLGRGGTVD